MTALFYNIPSDFDFLDMLAKRLMSETAHNPLRLKDYGIVLPDKLSCDMLKQKLQDLNGNKPMILPQIVTLDAIDDDVLSLRLAQDEDFVEKVLSLPPAVSHLQRELYLTREIMKHPETADSVGTAIGLARELAQFIDELHDANVPLDKLAQIDTSDFPGDLVKTRNILKIVTNIWPQIKSEIGVLDKAERQQQVLKLLSEYSSQNRLRKPLIIGGFNRVSRGMEDLMSTLAHSQGANVRLIFQGLDLEMGKSWETIGHSHPQFAHKKLLDDMGISRTDVNYWYGTTPSTHSQRAKERLKLLREAMRPSNTTHKWKDLSVFDKSKLRPSNKVVPKGSPLAKKMTPTDQQIDPIALTGMDMIVAGTQQEEVSAIALKFREMLEKDGATGTLITPDRALAARVAARIQQWGVEVAPEEGASLISTQVGRYMIYTADMAVTDLSPIPLLEALKSPYTAMGKSSKDARAKAEALEDLVLRGPRPYPGFKGLNRSLTAAFNAVADRLKSEERKAELDKTYKDLNKWLKAFGKQVEKDQKLLSSGKPAPLRELMSAHIRIMEAMAATSSMSGADVLWSGQQGVEAQKMLSNMLAASDIMPEITGADYFELIKVYVRDARHKCETHPRIRIVQPDKAHLFRSDMNIVAGLTEANWPGKQREKFWLSPELREKLGLNPIEAEIGYAAYDFVQGVSNKNTTMTRAERSASAPAVASPFLTRLDMLLQGLGIADKLNPKSQVMDINAALHRPAKVTPIDPPAPMPPADARPRRFSVSAIEQLLRDPYAVYARHVLKLYPKDPIDADPSFAERGNIIHDALDEFKRLYPDEMPKNAEEKLLEIGRKAFEKRMDNPSVRAFWWPRFERMAKWFVEYETAREGLARTLKTEVPGKMHLDTEKGRFILTAIADRIDGLMDDSLSIIDYKTGSVPSKKDVESGISPQLTLEALIAMSGGFEGIDAKNVGMVEYWKLSGGRPGGKVTQIDDIDRLQAEALEGLTKLMMHFADEDTPYLVTPRPGIMSRYLPYDHLSRSFEWGHGMGKNLSDKIEKATETRKKRKQKKGPKK